MRKRIAVVTLVLVFLAAIFAFAFLPVKAEARTIVVPDDYSTIQAAINMASAGDTVFVRKGYYTENLVINRSISVVGEDRNQTIIDARQTDGHVVFITDAPHVKFANFTLGNSRRSEIRFSGSGIEAIDGIRIGFAADHTSIINNTILLIPFGNGIHSQSSGTYIEGNTIMNCSHTAVYVEYFNNQILNNEYANIEYFIPIYASASSGNNTVEGNHEVDISFQSPFRENPEFPPSLILAPVIIAAFLIALVFLKKRKMRKQETPQRGSTA